MHTVSLRRHPQHIPMDRSISRLSVHVLFVLPQCDVCGEVTRQAMGQAYELEPLSLHRPRALSKGSISWRYGDSLTLVTVICTPVEIYGKHFPAAEKIQSCESYYFNGSANHCFKH
jgi:hypothetical protein